MNNIRQFDLVIYLAAVFVANSLIQPANMAAQNQGNNSVWSSAATPSTAYIDASSVTLSGSSNTDICTKIYAALGMIGATGYGTSTVIDARGVTNTACTNGNTPWLFGGTTKTPAATILLPAGTITTNTPWILPNGTHLIGEGTGAVGSSSTVVTAIQSSASTILQMGSSASAYCPALGSLYVCNGIAVENLVLDGGSGTTYGIYNANAQELSYVKHVALNGIAGTGFEILSVAAGSGRNSGPYSDITFSSSSASSICASITSVTTRGIHGLHCTNTGSSTGAAVYLDGSNNSVEDVTLTGFLDGIKIGANAAAQSNVILNVAGGATSTLGAVVHISTNASDVAIMGVSRGSLKYSIQDDLTAAGTSTTALTDSSVGLYAIGEKATITNAKNSYPRLTTSPTVPTWIRGTSNPSTPCAIGSLFSNSNGTGGTSDLWVCASSGWTGIF